MPNTSKFYHSNPIGFYVKTMSAHGNHLGWRSWSPDTILKVYYPRTKYNFDDIDKLMLKIKADDEFKIIVLKQRMFSMMVKALHSCHGKAISKRLSPFFQVILQKK
jgi:hypothetical protein